MKIQRLLLFAIILIIAASWLSLTKSRKQENTFISPGKKPGNPFRMETEMKLKEKAISARSFLLQKGFNKKICFFLDMSLPPGNARFFIYDLANDSLLGKGLVAHGNCFENWLEGRRYSNVVGSGCTSLGKYRIGIHYYGKFGYSYKLHGLDSSNNNAFERTVVLHAHPCVPESEVAEEICQSNGCPTVSPGFLEPIKNIINESKKPVLLWIYE